MQVFDTSKVEQAPPPGVGWKVQYTTGNMQEKAQLNKILRRRLLSFLMASGHELDEQGNMPFTITSPCGNSITYPDIDDIPMADVPCPCGNPNHWFVKYTEEWVNRN